MNVQLRSDYCLSAFVYTNLVIYVDEISCFASDFCSDVSWIHRNYCWFIQFCCHHVSVIRLNYDRSDSRHGIRRQFSGKARP